MSEFRGKALLLMALLGSAPCARAAEPEWVWYDGAELPMTGQGYPAADGKVPTGTIYERLPAAHTNELPAEVLRLQRHTAGMGFRFKTSSSKLSIFWKPLNAALSMWHMSASGMSGVDVYQRDAKRTWRYVHPPWHAQPKAEGASYVWEVEPNAPVQVYLPLYNGIVSFRLGIEKGATIEAAPYTGGVARPVVFYGTSTTQGGLVSRPGNCWPSVAARLLDIPQVNLGFSGAGRMEDVLAACLAEIDASCYVLDTAGNMDAQMIESRYEAFVRLLRAKRPEVPIVLAVDGWGETREYAARTAAVRRVYERLAKSGAYPKLYYAGEGDDVRPDSEGTVEGEHLNDLGAHRLGVHFARVLKKILKGE